MTHLCHVHHVSMGLFLENLAEGFSSSARAQHQLSVVEVLGQPLVHTTGTASCVLPVFVGSVKRVYGVAAV